MKVTQTIKFPAPDKQYEMHYFTVEVDHEDVVGYKMDMAELPPKQVWAMLQYVAQRECLHFAVTRGFMTLDQVKTQLVNISALLGDDLLKKVKDAGI